MGILLMKKIRMPGMVIDFAVPAKSNGGNLPWRFNKELWR